MISLVDIVQDSVFRRHKQYIMHYLFLRQLPHWPRNQKSLLLTNLFGRGQKWNHTDCKPNYGSIHITSKSSSWERGAKLVKATEKTNKYLDYIRDSHDPSLHLKTLEDELKGTMSKALGNQGEKVLKLVQNLNHQRARYDDILASYYHKNGNEKGSSNGSENELKLDDLTHGEKSSLFIVVQNHNRLRKEALHARWELLVHRQAVGFITNNHRFVHERFPIPESLQLPGEEKDWSEFQDANKSMTNTRAIQRQGAKEAVTRNFGDQLIWWERIGRWR